MEYGEAINPEMLKQAVAMARTLAGRPSGSLAAIAEEAVARVYCVCVTTGEDDAEQRVSDVHLRLVEAVLRQLEADAPQRDGRKF